MSSHSARSISALEDTPLLQAGVSTPCPIHNGALPSCLVHNSSSPKAPTSSPKPPSLRQKSISEETPLLQAGSSIDPPSYNATTPYCPIHTSPSSLPSPPHLSPPPSTSTSTSPRRCSSIIALVLLCTSIVIILSIGFIAPAAAAQYAKEAIILDISSLSVESFTNNGVHARIQATVAVDASRVRNGVIRNFGRLGTWLACKVSTKQSKVHVYLPGYGNGLLGTATVPAIVADIRNGHMTSIDFISEVETGSLDVARRVANDYLNGGLGLVLVRGEVDLSLKSGILSFGMQRISKEMTFEEIPSLPNFKVNRLNFGEATLPGQKALSANVSVTIENPFPLDFEIPSLSFAVLLPGCEAHDLVFVATAEISHLFVKPKTDIDLDISAVVRNLPGNFITACPKSHTSPMDNLLGGYLHGNVTTVYVRGSDTLKSDAPEWLLEFLRSVTLPVPFPGHPFDNVIKSFSLSNVKFRLPAPEATPGSPESSPRLSASVGAIIRLPEEIKFPIDVKRLRAVADVSYNGNKFGTLNLQKWMPANSSRSDGDEYIRIHAVVDDAPLDVTDYDVFEKVIGKVVFGDGKPVQLSIKGDADVDIKTNLGEFVIGKIPTAGNITIDAFSGVGSLPLPKANEVVIVDTTPQSITLRINLSINNPTPWEAVVPYVSVNISHENMILGNASISNMHVLPGNNTINVWVIWDPRTHGGVEAEKAGAQLIGEYVSGRNTTLTIRPHAESLPPLPLLSRALADFEVTIPTPRLGKSDDPNDDTSSRLIESATMHIFTSTADFLVSNPLVNNKITVNNINGTAKYNGSDLGTILYEWPFEIMPGKKGKTLTPRLPVDWSLDSVGYKAMRRAFGGQLKVHAEALCLVGVGKFEIELFYNSSKPIGAHIRL